ISRQLVLLDDKVALDVPLDELAVHEPDARKLIAFLKAMEFSTLTRRVAEYSQVDPANVAANAGVFSPLPLAEKVDESGNVPGPSQSGDLFADQKPASPKGRAGAPGRPGDRSDKTSSLKGTPQALAAARAEEARNTPVDRRKYRTIRNIAELETWIAKARDAGQFAFEAKASSEDPMQADICGIALALKPNDACYVPLGHRQAGDGSGLFAAGLAPDQINVADALTALRPLLESAGI